MFTARKTLPTEQTPTRAGSFLCHDGPGLIWPALSFLRLHFGPWRERRRSLNGPKRMPGEPPGGPVVRALCLHCWGLEFDPCGSDGKESACNAGDLGSIPGLGRILWRILQRVCQENPRVCLENPNGQRSLAGYRSGGRKELDTTEWLSTQTKHASHIAQPKKKKQVKRTRSKVTGPRSFWTTLPSLFCHRPSEPPKIGPRRWS